MDYRILGETLPVVEIRLMTGEAMYTQSGGMAWMSEGLTLDSNIKGGLMKGIGRMFTGESLFMATYTAVRPDCIIAFASTVPGRILPVDMSRTSLICQKGAFLCAQPTVEVSTVFTKKISAGFFGGEGFILQQLKGSGMAFLEVDGDQGSEEHAVRRGRPVPYQANGAWQDIYADHEHCRIHGPDCPGPANFKLRWDPALRD